MKMGGEDLKGYTKSQKDFGPLLLAAKRTHLLVKF